MPVLLALMTEPQRNDLCRLFGASALLSGLQAMQRREQQWDTMEQLRREAFAGVRMAAEGERARGRQRLPRLTQRERERIGLERLMREKSRGELGSET